MTEQCNCQKSTNKLDLITSNKPKKPDEFIIHEFVRQFKCGHCLATMHVITKAALVQTKTTKPLSHH